jgi:tetratricopeptide (TPR) repeat protein
MTTAASCRRWIGILLVVVLAIAGVTAWRFWPGTPPATSVERGFDAIRDQNWSEVLRAADKLKGFPRFAAEEHLFRGISLLKANRPSAALKEFGQLEPVGEIREPALLFTGEALYRLDRLADAQRLFATLASELPGHVEAHRWLAAIAYDLGDMNRTMDEIDIVMRLAPDDYRPLILKGQMLFDTERFADAAAAYSQVVARHPPSAVLEEVIPMLARAQLEIRDYAAAWQALSSAPDSAETFALRAECQLSLGNAAAARQLLTEAQNRDPEQLDVLKLWGRMELDAGRPEAAVSAFRLVLEREPADHEARHQLAQALRLSGHSAEADAEARRSSQII